MNRKILNHIVSGLVLGMAVGNLIAALTGHANIVSPALLEKAGSLSAALLRQTLLSGVIGGVAWAGMSFYDIERWPLRRSVAVHYASIMIVFLPVGFYLGWLERAEDALLMAGVMFAAHFSVFLIMWARYKAQVNEANRLIQQRKRQQEQTS